MILITNRLVRGISPLRLSASVEMTRETPRREKERKNLQETKKLSLYLQKIFENFKYHE